MDVIQGSVGDEHAGIGAGSLENIYQRKPQIPGSQGIYQHGCDDVRFAVLKHVYAGNGFLRIFYLGLDAGFFVETLFVSHNDAGKLGLWQPLGNDCHRVFLRSGSVGRQRHHQKRD